MVLKKPKKGALIPNRNVVKDPETGGYIRLPGVQKPPIAPTPAPSPKPIDDTFDIIDDTFTKENRDTWGALASYMRSIGLGSLLTLDKDGNPSGWLYDAVVDGVATQAELMIRLEKTPEFRDRFSVIIEQQKRVAAGEDVYVMTPQDVLNYEAVIDQTFSRVGMPEWFMNNREDMNNLILSGVSAEDVALKVDTAFSFVDSAPIEVRKAFTEFYGAGADAALAAYVLDSDMTMERLEQAQRTAYVAGIGRRFDVGVSREVAENVADLPLSEAGIIEGMQNIAAQSGLFQERFGETQDLTASETGVAAEFGGDADATLAMERRLIERGGVNRASTGGALLTQEGVVGL